MAEYCIYCGKELVNGKCDCPISIGMEVERQENEKLQIELEKKKAIEEIAARAEAEQKAAMERQEAERQAAIAAAEAESEAQAQAEEHTDPGQTDKDISKLTMSAITLIPRFFTKPYTLMQETMRGHHKIEGFMIGGVALIVLFLTSTIHLPIWGSSFIGIGYRAVIGLFVDLIAAVMVFAPALGIYIFRDKSGTEMKLLDIISAFSLLLMPVAFANILSFLFGFFAQSIAMLIMTIATMFISVLSLVAIYENCVGDKDLKIWKTVVVYAIVLIMISLVLGLMIAAVQAMLESAVNGIVDDIIPYNGFLG